MNRCFRFLALGLALAAGAASAQYVVREAPRDVRPGRLLITTPPEALLDGQPDRLSPGARIRNLSNLLVLSGTLIGQEQPVVYRRDTTGALHEIWLLTPEEYGKLGRVDPGNSETARRFAEQLDGLFRIRR